METRFNRLSAYQFKNGQVARNRVIVPPMASETATVLGEVSARTLEHYQRISESNASLVIVEYTYVHPSGRSEDHQLGIDQDDRISGLAEVAKAIHRAGALAGIQLTHSGGKSSRALTADQLMAPSARSVPVKDKVMELPRAMSATDIALWKGSFLAAAGRAVAAGFDLIEIHAAHGYGLNQWLSPLTNFREDQYGGTPGGRMKLLIEIVESIRKRYPQILISVRLPGQDFLEGGLSQKDSIQIAQALEKKAVDLIHVSSGIGGWRRPVERKGEGYLVPDAHSIQNEVSIPVIGVGGISSAGYIDEIISRGTVAFAAVGRAILSQPKAWSKNMEAAHS